MNREREPAHQQSQGKLPNILEAWETELIERIAEPIAKTIQDLREFRMQRTITCFYMTGSFARGHMSPTPKDVDFVVGLSARLYRGMDPSEVEGMRGKIEGKNECGVKIHLSYEPHGKVVKATDEGDAVETGEVRGERIMAAIPDEKKDNYVLVDFSDVKKIDAELIKRLYNNLKKHRLE